jgi:DNA-binding transcriptional LysR family regulator
VKNNPSLNDLAVFLAVLDEGGFRVAAKRLGIAPSKISTTVSRVEFHLGVPLLLRTTRSVRATDQGRVLADRIRPLLAGINAACDETANSTDRVQGKLKLNVPGAVMPDILPPLIGEFQSRHPAVEVEIVMENALVDIVASGCDAGIRYGAVLEKDMISIPIGPRTQQIALAASPEYLERRGWPQAPSELTQHDGIRYRLSGGKLLPWALEKEGEAIFVEPVTRLTIGVNALNTGVQFARRGLGIIAMFRNWLDDDFSRETLVPVLPDWWPEQEGPRLYYPNRLAPNPLRAFIDLCLHHNALEWTESQRASAKTAASREGTTASGRHATTG